jgi:hypothetical protein
MTKPINPENRNSAIRSVIDGSEVIAREMARLKVPASKSEDGMSPCRGVEKCLLADGREVFQCASPDDRSCNWWHETGESVRAHLRRHTIKTRHKVKTLMEENQALRNKEAQRKENYRQGALRSAESRRLNREARVNAAENSDDTPASSAATATTTATELGKTVSGLALRVDGLADGLDKVRVVLGNMINSAEAIAEDLEKLPSKIVSEPDPTLVEKAQSWDDFQALMGRNAR